MKSNEGNSLNFQEMSGANGELGMCQGNKSANREPYGLAVSTMNKVSLTANRK